VAYLVVLVILAALQSPPKAVVIAVIIMIILFHGALNSTKEEEKNVRGFFLLPSAENAVDGKSFIFYIVRPIVFGFVTPK
jgi:hypothetical protein